MRLMETGEVDGKHWAQVCRQLHWNLKADAMRSCLGQLASSSLNLSTLTDCADTKSIRNLLKLGTKGRPCHFGLGGTDSRVHWCHECPAWQPAFVQVALTASAHLATGGNSLWFRPDFRLGLAGLDCKMISDKEAWMRGSGFLKHSDPQLVTRKTGLAVPAGGMGRDARVATKERITCLCGLWGQTDAISVETYAGAEFQQAAYEVLYECVRSMLKVLQHNTAKTRHVKEQPGDSLASYYWRVTVDRFCPDMTGPVAPWSHRCLVVLNESRDGTLS